MKFLRALLDRQAHHFEPGGKLEKLYPFWEAQDTILFTPGTVTGGPSHVRDGLDLKRLMIDGSAVAGRLHLHGRLQHRLSGEPGHCAGSAGARELAERRRSWPWVSGSALTTLSRACCTARSTICRSYW